MSLLGIDIGTAGCKAATFSVDGALLGEAYRKHSVVPATDRGLELDSREVWEKTRAVIAEAAAAAGRDPVAALRASSCGEAVVPVTRDREILDRSILSADVRGGEYVERLLAETALPLLRELRRTTDAGMKKDNRD